MSALNDLIVKHKESNEPITTLENVILNAWYADFVDVDKAAAELAALRDVLMMYGNEQNWKSINGLMVLQTLDHPWNPAKAALKGTDHA